MRVLYRLVFVVVILASMVSCGGEQAAEGMLEAHSMDEAVALAAQNNSFIVIEFWLDG